MALTYTLTLAGEITAEAIIERAFPNPSERPVFGLSGVSMAAAIEETLGFSLYVLPVADGYLEAGADGEAWSWEPGACVDVTFRLAGGDEHEHAASMRNMMTLVYRLLDTGAEPAAFVFNDDTLLLRRDAEGVHRFSGGGFWGALAAIERGAPSRAA